MASKKRQPASNKTKGAATAVPLPWWVALGVIAITYGLLRIHAVSIPLDRDEGVFGYAGQRILEGGRLYLDVVDHKPPGVFYLYALALRLFSPTPQGVHWFLHAYNFLTLLGIWILMRCRFASPWASFWGAFCYAVFSASPEIQGFTASTEMLMLLPIVISLWLAVEAAKRPRIALFLASGAAAAAAFWIKQTALTSVAFAGLYVAFSAWRSDRDGAGKFSVEAARRLFWWCAGGAIVSGVTVGYFKATGLFPDFVYWSFTHNIVYAGQIPLSDTLSRWIRALGTIVHGEFAVIGLGLAGAFWNLRRKKEESLFVLGFSIFSLAGTLPGLSYPHYFAQLAPAVAVASGWTLAVLSESGTFKSRTAILGAALVLVLIPSVVHRDYFFESVPNAISRRYFGSNPFPESAELSEYLASHTSLQDRIFIIGSEPQILLQAKRKSASPFVMIYPLTRQYPRYLEFQERVWQDVVNHLPAYILMVDISASALWDGQADLTMFRRLEQLIRDRYELEAVMPVRPPEGHLVVLPRGSRQAPEGTGNSPSISVYRLAAAGSTVNGS